MQQEENRPSSQSSQKNNSADATVDSVKRKVSNIRRTDIKAAVRRRLPRRSTFFLLCAFLLFAMGLRSPFTSLAPLAREIGCALSLRPALVGALTSIPVLCFGLVTPLASMWMAKVGINRAGFHTLMLIVVGALIRSSGDMVLLFAGTIVIGVGITLGNLVAPVVIGRDFPSHAALVTGMYSAFINIVVTFSTALAVPVAQQTSWKFSALVWGLIPALPALFLWIRAFPLSVEKNLGEKKRGTGTSSEKSARDFPRENHLRPRLATWVGAWVMTFFFACQSFSYYGVSSWLPTALGDIVHLTPTQAGIGASIFQCVGIIGPLLVPAMYGMLHWSRARVMAVVTAGWMCLPFGLIFIPSLWPLWCTISGFSQGANFTALFTIVIQRSRNVHENRALSAMIQTGGYLVAGTSPVLLGHIHELTGTWILPFALVGLATLIMAVGGQYIARDTSSPELRG